MTTNREGTLTNAPEETTEPETKIEVPEGKELLEFELGVTLHGGVQVPVEVFIVYPEGNGLHAVKAVEQQMATGMNALYQELVNRQDAATIQKLLASGHAYEGDE